MHTMEDAMNKSWDDELQGELEDAETAALMLRDDESIMVSVAAQWLLEQLSGLRAAIRGGSVRGISLALLGVAEARENLGRILDVLERRPRLSVLPGGLS